MSRSLQVLLVEDNPADAELLVRTLSRAGFTLEWRRVDTEQAFLDELRGDLDLVLSDYDLPEFSGPRALELLKQRQPDVPFILVSGTIGEETAVAAIKLGAADYFLKDRLTRLGSAVTRALAESRLRRDSRQAEESLRQSELKFARAFANNPAAIALTRLDDGVVLEVNDTWVALCGFSREEIVGQSARGIWPTPEAATRFVRELREKGVLRGWEQTFRKKSGEIFVADLASQVLTIDDERVILSTLVDVTAHKEAEQAVRESEARFRELAENIQEVFWVTDPTKNQMLYLSPGYEKIWGRPCQSVYDSPRTWLGAIRPEDRQRVIDAMLTKQAEGTYDEEYRIVRPDGSERWIRDRAFPVRDAEGKIRRIVGVAEDITESKKLQEQFLRAQRMEAIGTLAGGIAHDLNNILAPVVMGAGLLKYHLTAPRELELVDMMERAAKRGSSVIRQLLTFSRGIAGERVSLQLRHLLNEMADIIRETFPRDIVFVDSAPRTLRVVTGDPTQLHQVLMNLCVNARDAMPKGGKLTISGANVELSAAEVAPHPLAKPGPYVTVSVTDTGHGIPPDIVDRIFDPFFTTKPASKGTGLGLSSALGIVRSHNGFLTVTSEPGHGTIFTVHLPAGGQEKSDVAATAGADALPTGKGELIMVVDDEEPIRTTTRLVLEQHGYRVITAGDGADAVALLMENRDAVRLVLTDVMMPVMGGTNLIRVLRVIEPKLTVLAMSGLADEATQAELRDVGVDGFLSKPCDQGELLEAVHQRLAGAGPR